MGQRKHLAIFSADAAKQILIGKKTVEIRLSQKRIEPFGIVQSGDLVYIKPSGEEIVGQFIVKKVVFYDFLDENDFNHLKKTFGQKLNLGSSEKAKFFFEQHQDAKFATIIEIGQTEQFITSPIKIPKRDSRGWVVLE